MRLKINAETQKSSYKKFRHASQYLLRQFEAWNSAFGYEDIEFEVGFVPVILSNDLLQFSHTAEDRWSFINGNLYVGSKIAAERFNDATEKEAIELLLCAFRDALTRVEDSHSFGIHVDQYLEFVRLVLNHLKD